MFDKFADYMYTLLPGPLKKAQKSISKWYILFAAIGGLFDKAKADLIIARDQAFIISCSEILLDEYGKERDMPRLQGETTDNYRGRLMLKNEIAEAEGTNKGILDALAAAGYKEVYTEPFSIYDQDRWAEFAVMLGENTSGVITDVTKMDREVSKLKPASGKAVYITETTRQMIIKSACIKEGIVYPMCGLQQCGTPVNIY